MPRAIAIDLGATSGRIALGELSEGKIAFRIEEQISHEAKDVNGRLEWDLKALLGLVERGAKLGADQGAASIGIDSWGVDHGFLDKRGELISAPVCYRDLSHLKAFDSLAGQRRTLYALTGIQHQPFNTICQLVARRSEDPAILEKVDEWMILPDLLGYLVSGVRNQETTQASTTQLQGVDGAWSKEAFEIAGWPLPKRAPQLPGGIIGSLPNGLKLASVGSHDTASAVVGFGALGPHDMFLNVGTWSLAGYVCDTPITTPEVERMGFTNERMVDGRIRFLKNIPGFYFINRLHAELAVPHSVPDWLSAAEFGGETIDLFHPDFFNPASMKEACLAQISRSPYSIAQWAGLAIASLVAAVGKTSSELEHVTGRAVRKIRVGGGGSQSVAFCKSLSETLSLPVVAGPAEATVVGNLAAQFLALGEFRDWEEAYQVVESGIETAIYQP